MSGARSIVRRRSTSALGPRPARRPSPVIVKLASAQRTHAAARAVVAYIARVRPSDQHEPADRRGQRPRRRDPVPVVRDETGAVIGRDDLMAQLGSWNLQADEHATPRARMLRRARASAEWRDGIVGAVEADDTRAMRRLMREAGVPACATASVRRICAQAAADIQAGIEERDLPPAEAWRSVVARHLIYSVPVRHRGEVPLLEMAAAAAIVDSFTGPGHRCLWTLHIEHGREPHVHVLVSNRDDLGRPLVFERDGLLLDSLRDSLAEHARLYGLDVEATRQADRPELVQAVVEGRQLLPDSERRLAERAEAAGRRADLDPVIASLARRAPAWTVRFAGRPPRRAAAAPDDAGYELLRTALEPVFGDQLAGALESYIALRDEESGRRQQAGRPATAPFADWLLLHRPQTFAPARRRPDRQRLRAALRRAPRPTPRVEPVDKEALLDTLRRAGRRVESTRALQQERDVGKVVRHLVELAWHEETLIGGAEGVDRAVALRDRAHHVALTPLGDAGRSVLDKRPWLLDYDRRRRGERGVAEERGI